MKRSHFAILVAALSLTSVAVSVAAPRPAPPPAPFVPEVIYPYQGKQYTDLRLSNAAGTAAILVHRGTLSFGAYDLAPPSRRMATFVSIDANGTRYLQIRSWIANASTGAITIGEAQTLDTSRSIFLVDFSPTGDRIAYASFVGGNAYDLKVVNLADRIITTVATVDGPSTLRWSKDGSSLYYATREVVNGIQNMSAFRQPIAGGTPQFLFGEANIEPWDISRGSDDGLIFLFSRPGWNYLATGTWNGTSVTEIPGLTAGSPHYSCGNDRLIYRSYANGNPGPVKIRTFATSSDVTFSRDQNIKSADFMPCD